MLTKETKVDRREILADGQIQVREATHIIEDGKIISTSYHRYVVSPGDDVSNLPSEVQRTAQNEHTPEVVEKFRAKKRAV